MNTEKDMTAYPDEYEPDPTGEYHLRRRDAVADRYERDATWTDEDNDQAPSFMSGAITIALVAGLIWLLTGCSHLTTNQDGTEPDPPDLVGRSYSGSWTSQGNPGTGYIYLTFGFDDTVTVYMEDSPCFDEPLGHFTYNPATGLIDIISTQLFLQGQAIGDRLLLEYQVEGGLCGGDYGTISVYLVPTATRRPKPGAARAAVHFVEIDLETGATATTTITLK